MTKSSREWNTHAHNRYIQKWRIIDDVVEAVIGSYTIKIDKEDKDLLLNNRWYISGRGSHQLQTSKKINGKWRSVSIQRVILLHSKTSNLNTKYYIKHIDGDWTNNCKSNLYNDRDTNL